MLQLLKTAWCTLTSFTLEMQLCKVEKLSGKLDAFEETLESALTLAGDNSGRIDALVGGTR